ncbi:MAG: hypothetical protein QXY74_05535 [Candidatus Bathyarchaeia archaeon]
MGDGKVLTIYKSGGISYSTEETEENLKGFTFEGTWSEARKIAENFLEKMRTYGLWPKNPLMSIEFREVGWAALVRCSFRTELLRKSRISVQVWAFGLSLMAISYGDRALILVWRSERVEEY